jgi:hypothetical protein
MPAKRLGIATTTFFQILTNNSRQSSLYVRGCETAWLAVLWFLSIYFSPFFSFGVTDPICALAYLHEVLRFISVY